MSITPVLALGLVSQSIFFGGNIAISSIFIPIIRQKQVPPKLQVKMWEKTYDDASKLMAGSAFVGFLCYMYEAYTANPGTAIRQAAVVSGVLSISVIPFTLVAIMGTVKKLKNLSGMESEQELIHNNFGGLIDYWNKLSIARALVFSAGFANALFYHIRN